MPFINKIRLAKHSFINMFFTIFVPFRFVVFSSFQYKNPPGSTSRECKNASCRAGGWVIPTGHDMTLPHTKVFFLYITTSLTVAAAFSVVAVT